MAFLVAIVEIRPARGEKLRIGLIDPIDGRGVPIHLFEELQRRLIAVDATGALGNAIHLSRCTPEQISNSQHSAAQHSATQRSAAQHSVDGACGRPVQLPDEWMINAESDLYRGVACGPYRPGTSIRDELNDAPPEPWGARRHLVDSNVPNDVVAIMDDSGTVHVGCDWNADLEISVEERFTLHADKQGKPQLFQRDDAIVMMQLVQDSDRSSGANPGDHLAVRLWTISGTARDRWSRWDQSALSVMLSAPQSASDFELLWLDVGGLMPADLGASMNAAKRLDCDFVLADLDASAHHSTDMAQLLANLSHETGVPVVVNGRTTVSPNFVVHPARTSIPDAAEFQFENESTATEAFGRVVNDLLSNPESLRAVVREELGTDLSLQPESLFNDEEIKIGFDHFEQIDGSKHVVARVPFDAVDGQLQLDGDSLPVSFSELTNIRMYDVRGRRISGSDHSNGVSVDRAPPMEVPLSRGGYLIAPTEFFWRGKTFTLSDPKYRIRWISAMNPVFETIARTIAQRSGRRETVRLIGSENLPKTLTTSDTMRLARLTRHSESEVPDAVRRAASHLLDRGPMVRSWWYRAAPRNGSIHYRPVFQEVGDQLPAWEDSHLQYWTFLESGWMKPQSGRMGDLGLSTPQTAWILLQAASVRLSFDDAPQLVQSLESVGGKSNRVWKRFYHESRLVNPERPAEGSVWIDEYRSTMRGAENDGADILWGAFRVTSEQAAAAQDASAQGLAVRWMRAQVIGNSPRKERDWLWYYDHDATAEFLQQSLLDGSTPSEVLSRHGKPDEASKDLMAWRCHLLSLDQPSIRKQHLDQVVTAAEKVLRLCDERLEGLPAPEDPYRREWEATIGAGAPGSPSASTPYLMPSDPAQVQTYAWAADAAYRKVRAIGYRELPDVVIMHPIEDMEAQNREFESAFTQLCGLVDIKNYRFVLTLVRYERRRGNPSQAYEMLWRNASQGPAMPWYFKKERDLWSDGGWEPLRRLGHARWFLRESNQPVMH